MNTAHKPATPLPWKRWNQKGSTNAHRRMAELRDAKDRAATDALARNWRVKAGLANATFDEARAILVAGGFPFGCPEEDRREWYRRAMRDIGEA